MVIIEYGFFRFYRFVHAVFFVNDNMDNTCPMAFFRLRILPIIYRIGICWQCTPRRGKTTQPRAEHGEPKVKHAAPWVNVARGGAPYWGSTTKRGRRPQRLETNYPNVIMRAHDMDNGNFISSAWGECPLKIVLPPVGHAWPNALVLSAWLNRMGIGHIILITDKK